MHLCTSRDQNGDSWTILRSEIFCSDLVNVARKWVASKQNDLEAITLLNSLVDIRTNVPPLSIGVPLICAAI